MRRIRTNWLVLLVGSVAGCTRAGGPVLDKQALLDRQTWWDNRDWAWYQASIPFFESPDTAIDATYYYRWELITKHLTYGSPENGYTFTEFLDRPFWSGAYGSISCPLGHQFYEVRWLKDRRVIEDFARYWFETPGAQPRSYSNWYGDAMWATYLVLGDTNFIRAVFPHMEVQYQGWVQEHWDPQQRMFRWDGMHDGMETNINSRQTVDPFAGAEGYRPTLNSYLYADQAAIARAAALLGDSIKARRFLTQAFSLKRRVQDELWDPERRFFFHQFARNETESSRRGKGGRGGRGGRVVKAKTRTYETGRYAGNPHGREEIGFVPWQFNLADPSYLPAWRYLMDPHYFFAPFGPTTVERHDPQFYIARTCCVWSGNSWPYATTQTLEGLANVLDHYRQSYVTKSDYLRLLKTYTLPQRWNGHPYIAEAANPDNGSWEGHYSLYDSEHYFHSGYIDLIITGLVGLRPRADDTLEVNPLAPDDWPYFALDYVTYHGHALTILWDRDGTHYRRGAGLTVLADGRLLARAPRIERVTVPLGARPRAPTVERLRNLAVNNDRGPFPWVTASYSAPEHPPFYLIDGNYWYHRSPPNRWTTEGSPNASDWIVLDFGIERPLDMVKLYLLDDGKGVTAPARFDLQLWRDGAWQEIPDQRRSPPEPQGRRANVVSFPRVTTSKLRVTLTHQPRSASGLTELEAWARVNLPLPPPVESSHDIAYGARATASFTGRDDRVEDINDLRIAFTRYSRNRWTAYASPNRQDWVELDFGQPKSVRQLDLYLWGDSAGVKAPRRYTVQYWDGAAWRDARVRRQVPPQPSTWAVNTVRIDSVETDRLRVVFAHDVPAVTGVTELVVWDRIP
jgi:hypothetical protein